MQTRQIITYSIGEIVEKARNLKTNKEKIEYLRANNSQALRTILTIIYDSENYVWNLPNTVPPYTKSDLLESHGALRREIRKIPYFFKGFSGDNIPQHKRESIFISMLESVDNHDADLLIYALTEQKPYKDLSVEVINEALNMNLPKPKAKTKK